MFGFIFTIFNILLYQPLFNALIFIYDVVPGGDFGIAIILLTLLIRIVLYPIFFKSIVSQRALQKLQPKIQEIQKKYKDDKEKQAKETLELYKTEKINPFSGLLLVIVQLPILIALYRVFWGGLDPASLVSLYSFVHNPGQIHPLFLSLVDLSKPSLIFAALAGIAQFFQTKMLLSPTQKGGPKDFSETLQKQMVYLSPIISIVILSRLPAALGLYWIISGVFSIWQQYVILKKVS